jgi:hypothetical protein
VSRRELGDNLLDLGSLCADRALSVVDMRESPRALET